MTTARTDVHLHQGHRRGRSVLLTTVIGLGGLVAVCPLIWLVIASTRTSNQILTSPQTLLPGGHFIQNLTGLLQSSEFGHALVNSVVVSVLYTSFAGIVTTTAGYAFAKFTFRGRGILFSAVLLTLALPVQVTLVPLFQIMVNLGWLNSYQALVLPNLALPFGIFLMRQSSLSIPDEILQAARVDGAGEFRIFWQVVLPVLRPALATLGIFLFLAQWNDFVYALVVMRTPTSYTLPVALATLHGVGSTDYGQILVGTLISVVPVLAVFLSLQKYFVAGMLTGSVKQ